MDLSYSRQQDDDDDDDDSHQIYNYLYLKIYYIYIFKFMFIGSKICGVYSTPCDKFYIHGPQKFSSQMEVMELKVY